MTKNHFSCIAWQENIVYFVSIINFMNLNFSLNQEELESLIQLSPSRKKFSSALTVVPIPLKLYRKVGLHTLLERNRDYM